ncbi:MAG: SgcJ/EcaC family oxidoreductase [Planctomycetaceae bacterium]|nr:SgcJ/EcaC family oxidoreductase [Planctomycetaceae bacterium]
MRLRRISSPALFAIVAVLTATPAWTQDGKGSAQDKEAIAKKAEAFVEAFHKGDAKALAAFWIPEGDYTSQTGRAMKGQDAIEKAFKKFFAENKALKLGIESESLRFVTPDVAIEDGVSTVLSPDGTPPSRVRYSNVYVKRDGEWYLSSMRDTPYVAPSNYEHLQGLEFAIGSWSGKGSDGEEGQLTVSWAENQNFVHAVFSTSVGGVSVSSAHHIIGWDPLKKTVRSWIFDRTGGFGEAAWTLNGKKWVLKTTSVLQDGNKASATYVLTRVDENTVRLQAKDQTVDGETIPDGKDMTLKRID